jgi:hypothetical protein
MKKLWFKAKNYGWGWYPSSWEGWAVLAGFLAVSVWIFRDVDSQSHSVSDTLYGVLVPFFVLTAALLAVCWKTGEKPEWRWGGKSPWKKKD